MIADLKPYAEYRDSGQEWVGSIPAHWSLLRARFLFRENKTLEMFGESLPPDAEIMVDHFHEQVLAAGKIGGQARAMGVTSGIERAVQYYRATLLAEETDPNKLHDLKAALDGAQVYSPDQVQQFAALFLAGAERDQLDPIQDACVAAYTGALDEDQQVDFNGKAKVFCRTCDFLASVMPGKPEPELDRLSNIHKTFNDNFGTLFDDMDRVVKRIRNDIAPRVAADKAFQNARDNTPHTARMAHDQALAKAAQILLKDDTLFYKQFVENDSFRRSVGDMVYQITSQPPARGQP